MYLAGQVAAHQDSRVYLRSYFDWSWWAPGTTLTAMNEEDDTPTPVERSAVAKDIESLQKTVLRLAEEREVLPQPLFWSLFHTRLESIRKHKNIERTLRECLDGE